MFNLFWNIHILYVNFVAKKHARKIIFIWWWLKKPEFSRHIIYEHYRNNQIPYQSKCSLKINCITFVMKTPIGIVHCLTIWTYFAQISICRYFNKIEQRSHTNQTEFNYFIYCIVLNKCLTFLLIHSYNFWLKSEKNHQKSSLTNGAKKSIQKIH